MDGIEEETPNETWEDCEIKIQELIKNKLKMNEHIEIDRCHRLSTKKNQNRPRTISSCYRTVPSAIWEIFSEFLIFCNY